MNYYTNDYGLETRSNRTDKTLFVEANNSSTIKDEKVTFNIKHIIEPPEAVDCVAIERKKVSRIAKQCQEIETLVSFWPELMIGLSTLFGGAFLGALANATAFEFGWRAILFYCIFPAISVGTFVAFIFLRIHIEYTAKEKAISILECLPTIKDSKMEEERK